MNHENQTTAGWISNIYFWLFAVLIIAWTTSLTLFVMDIVLPNSPMKWLAVALFDGGALAWASVYVFKARGTEQRSASILMTVLDLAGVLAMVIGAIYMGGQDLADIPDWMGEFVVNIVIGATVLNVIAIYYFHMSSPEIRERIQAGTLEDMLNNEANDQAKHNVEREARILGAILARRATARIKNRLQLPMTRDEIAEWNGEEADYTGIDVTPLPQKSGRGWRGLLSSIFSFFSPTGSNEQLSLPDGRNEPSDSNESSQNDQKESMKSEPARADAAKRSKRGKARGKGRKTTRTG